MQNFFALVVLLFLPVSTFASSGKQVMVEIEVSTPQARTELLDQGLDIWNITPTSVVGRIQSLHLASLAKRGFRVREVPITLDFPAKDAAYHNYDEMLVEFKTLQQQYKDIAQLVVLGSSLEGRSLWALKIGKVQNLPKQAVVFMGAHHAREHLSVEVPLGIASYFLNQSATPEMAKLLEQKDIWIIPMVNPDGAEHDIRGDYYHFWRKNRRLNDDGSYGVDLNRNYGYQWGGIGASSDPQSDTYRGKSPFSESETQVIRDFLKSLPLLDLVVSYHTFSELILYPWGYTNNPIGDPDGTFMVDVARKLASITGYTPMQGSSLYFVSGETCDWVYGELKRVCFTFELSPQTMWEGGFYPGGEIIEQVVNVNIPAAVYLAGLQRNGHSIFGRWINERKRQWGLALSWWTHWLPGLQ